MKKCPFGVGDELWVYCKETDIQELGPIYAAGCRTLGDRLSFGFAVSICADEFEILTITYLDFSARRALQRSASTIVAADDFCNDSGYGSA